MVSLEERGSVLAPPIVFTEQEAVVGADDEHRVVPHVVLIHGGDDPAERAIAHGEQRGIQRTDMGHGLGGFADSDVVGPIQFGTVIGRVCLVVPLVVELAVVLVGEEGLVRVEGLDLGTSCPRRHWVCRKCRPASKVRVCGWSASLSR